MDDLARLGIAIDSRSAVTAAQALDRFKQSGANAETQTRKLEREARTLRVANDNVAGSFRTTAASIAVLNGPLGQVSGRFSSFATVIRDVGPELAGAAVAFAALGFAAKHGIGAFAEYEQGLRNVAAVSGSTADELKQLDKAALSAATSTRFNPTQATQALYALASSGQTATQQIASLPAVLNLAEAGQADLGQSTELLTSTLNVFGIAATDSASVADTFVAAIGASAFNVDRLQVAMRNAAPTSAALGQSFVSTTATLAELTTAFGNGERAGSGLRAIFNELPDKAKGFGISIKDAHGQFLPLIDVLRQFEQRGISATQIIETFGPEAGPALAVLLKNGSGALATMTTRLTSTGQAASTASQQLDTLKGDLDKLTSAISVSFVEMGRAESGVVRVGVQTVTNLIKLWSGYGDSLGKAQASTEALSNVITTTLSVGGLALLARSLNLVGGGIASFIGQTYAAMAAARAEAVAQQTLAAARLRSAELAYANAKANAVLGASFAVVSRELLAARTAMVAADAAMAATTVTARVASVAMRGLSGAMALVGGPVGVALIGSYAIYELAKSQQTASQAADTHRTALEKLNNKIAGAAGMSIIYQAQLRNEILLELHATETALADAEAQANKHRYAFGGIFDNLTGTGPKQEQEAIASLKKTVYDLKGDLAQLGASPDAPRTISELNAELAKLSLTAGGGDGGGGGGGAAGSLKGLNEQINLLAANAPNAFEEYAKAAQDASQIGDVISNGLSGAEDALVEFVTTGKASFGDLANSIIADLIRIALKQNILGPLSSALGSLFGGGSSYTYGSGVSLGGLYAKGGVFDQGGPVRFARGGIVSRPTIFPFAGGAGLMGEAGPEAIMPLTRDSSGRLGVAANSNSAPNVTVIVNNAPAGTTANTSAKSNPSGGIDVIVDLVDTKLAERAASGTSTLSGTMEQMYGLNRAAGAR